VRFPGNDCVRQRADGSLKFLVRDGVIARFQGGFAPCEGGFALGYGSLAPLHFALGDVIWRLRQRDATNEKNDGDNCL